VTGGELIDKAFVGVGNHRVRKRGQVFIELDVGLELGEFSACAINLAQPLLRRSLRELRLGYG